MWFLRSEVEKNNVRLRDFLQVDAGRQVRLQLRDGAFLTPADYLNEHSSLAHMETPGSIVELFLQVQPLIGKYIRIYERANGTFDRLDYTRFKSDAKLAYLIAATAYVHYCAVPFKRINDLFTPSFVGRVLEDARPYAVRFLNEKRGQDMFACCCDILSRNCQLPSEFSSREAFTAYLGFSPYGNSLGEGFERRMEDEFSTVERSEIQSLFSRRFGIGLIVGFDTDPALKSYAQKHAKGISIPDYLYVTQDAIYPIDLKVNLQFAKAEQVSATNARMLFRSCAEKIRPLFAGIPVEDDLLR